MKSKTHKDDGVGYFISQMCKRTGYTASTLERCRCETGRKVESSIITVMVVGFVSSGLMNLSQAINVIIGSNIGTTTTSFFPHYADAAVVNGVMTYPPMAAPMAAVYTIFNLIATFSPFRSHGSSQDSRPLSSRQIRRRIRI